VALSEIDIEAGMMTRHAAAEFLGCSITTVDRMIRSGELESVRIRKAIRITRAACVQYLNATSNTAARRPGRPRKGAA
jgi:excisionase family DNA binding protein